MCFRKQTPITQTPMPAQVPPDNEADLIRRAFGIIQRRITEHLAGYFPDAHWVWSLPNAQARIAAGEPVHIMLNQAGGYRSAEVQIVRLQFKGLKFASLPASPPQPEQEEPAGTDYSYLAFEWVEAHLLELNERLKEAIGCGESELCLSVNELPDPASWQAICDELQRNGFSKTEVTETGITTKIIEEEGN